MFDVPVLEVTVSSAPALTNGVSRTNQITLQKPTISSGLLETLAVLLPQQVRQQSHVFAEALPTDSDQIKTLLPDRSFQLLEPLNLAYGAESLEQAFATSSLSNPLSQIEAASTTSSSDIPSIAAQTPEFGKTQASQNSSTSTTTNPVVAEPESPTPVMPRQELQQCVDIPYAAPQGTATLQVLLRGNVIGAVNSTNDTEQVAQSLQAMLVDEPINPHEIAPVLGSPQPAIRLSSDILLKILTQENRDDVSVDSALALSNEWAAIAWSDHLRQKMGAAPLDAGTIQLMFKGLKPSEQELNGIASWYGPYFHGRLTANGETFDQNTLTAAHKSLPFNTILQVRNLNNNRTVVVRINDRGPYIGKRSLDLSKAAAQCLGSDKVGVIPYEAVLLE
ncbi:septal ring lytic transglycosylase RlpA family protein [Leptothoe sp. ISB3NOV94-8A]|nr:septal ring lytic transglycosylase RlpA family protein [Adonisia turfae]MDV3347742.1 septal ring lytic transglycosylase RlpA family protein [Leptothoe sp. LEGE 181152]